MVGFVHFTVVALTKLLEDHEVIVGVIVGVYDVSDSIDLRFAMHIYI